MTSKHKTPGQLIIALLEERGWTRRLLAVVLKMDETGINKLVQDKRPVTADIAISLEEVFGVPAEEFLALQQQFDLASARLKRDPDLTRRDRAMLLGGLPISEMMKRGWIETADVRDVAKIESELARFFGVKDVSEVEFLPHAAKKTEVATEATPAQLAWLYRVKQISAEMLVPSYRESSLLLALPKLKALMSSPEETRKVPRILAECGIRYVLVESLASAKIDGVCFWMAPDAPVIGMSIRFDRIDNFWFVLRHEIEHVLRRHGQSAVILDVELEGDRAGVGSEIAEEERVANEAAAAFCVPPSKIESFIARKAPFFSERDILGLANTLGVHPGLVAGQLQRRTGRYDRFRNHLVKIRGSIAPSAIVDGWGDVAPVGI